MAVNKEHIKKWADALRSGEYKQATGALRFDDGYCCLGVACDISGVGEWRQEGTEVVGYVDSEDYSASTLTWGVQKWLGFDDDADPAFIVIDDNTKENASVLNDSNGYTFEEIADAIERTYLNE